VLPAAAAVLLAHPPAGQCGSRAQQPAGNNSAGPGVTCLHSNCLPPQLSHQICRDVQRTLCTKQRLMPRPDTAAEVDHEAAAHVGRDAAKVGHKPALSTKQRLMSRPHDAAENGH
jgi:hypothetical protein